MIGKVSPAELVELVCTHTGADDTALLQGPAYGEDTAAIALGDHILVVNADPLSLAADSVGTLAIHVVANDIAASGADPRWVTNTMFLPDDNPDQLQQIITQLHAAATELGITIVGGHTEYLPSLERPLLSLTCLGITDTYVPTGGATPGDVLMLAGAAGIEGTAILANDFAETLRERGISPETIQSARGFLDDISIVPIASQLRDFTTSMHDPTEGGLTAGLVELAHASSTQLSVDLDAIPIRPETDEVCTAMDVDPLAIFGSGALLCTLPDDRINEAKFAAADIGVSLTTIGRVGDGKPRVQLGDASISEAPRDELYALWE